MLGNFRYCSSSSESSDGEDDSDTSSKSDDYLDRLLAQKKSLEDKIKERDNKLKEIQLTLKQLNEQRKILFKKRNELAASSNEFNRTDTERVFPNGENMNESEELILPNSSSEPLNLDPHVRMKINEEEFDSEDE